MKTTIKGEILYKNKISIANKIIIRNYFFYFFQFAFNLFQIILNYKIFSIQNFYLFIIIILINKVIIELLVNKYFYKEPYLFILNYIPKVDFSFIVYLLNLYAEFRYFNYLVILFLIIIYINNLNNEEYRIQNLYNGIYILQIIFIHNKNLNIFNYIIFFNIFYYISILMFLFLLVISTIIIIISIKKSKKRYY